MAMTCLNHPLRTGSKRRNTAEDFPLFVVNINVYGRALALP
jgi:hypothetical protein